MTPDERDAAYLILEDGSVFAGERLGAEGMAVGEVVFNTSMTGYQEMLTDPSYGGQILIPTYPMIGNYGINARDWESGRIQVRGLVVRQDCDRPSNPDSVMTVDEYLQVHGIPGVSGVDTRAITRRLRTQGVMMGVVTGNPDIAAALAAIEAAPRYGEEDVVGAVTASAPWACAATSRATDSWICSATVATSATTPRDQGVPATCRRVSIGMFMARARPPRPAPRRAWRSHPSRSPRPGRR